MKLFYVPTEKKTGSPICVLNKPENLSTSKGVTKAWRNHDFISGISGTADLVMEWMPENKDKFGKGCVLEITNFTPCEIDTSKPETRLWFCKGNFKREGLENTPIVHSDGKGKNRKNFQKIELKNVSFEMKLNNAISKEKQSGATTILRVF